MDVLSHRKQTKLENSRNVKSEFHCRLPSPRNLNFKLINEMTTLEGGTESLQLKSRNLVQLLFSLAPEAAPYNEKITFSALTDLVSEHTIHPGTN